MERKLEFMCPATTPLKLPLTTIFFWVVTAQQPTQRNHNLIRHEFCINLIAKVEPLVNGGPPKKVQDFRRQNLPTGSEN